MHYTWVSSSNRHDKYTSIQFILSCTGYRNLTLIRRVFHQTMMWRKVYQSWAEDWWSDQAPTPKSNSWLSLVVKPRSSKSKSLISIDNTSWITNYKIYTTGQGNKLETRWPPRVLFVMQPVTMISLKALKFSYAFNLGKMYGHLWVWLFYFASEMCWILVNLMSTW